MKKFEITEKVTQHFLCYRIKQIKMLRPQLTEPRQIFFGEVDAHNCSTLQLINRTVVLIN
jgi:hypothetical protein